MDTDLQEWTVLSMLRWGTGYFEKKELPDPRLSIEWLLAEVLKVKRLDLYLSYDRPLSTDELSELRPLVKRRAQHEPLQYIKGVSEFMNIRLRVTPAVLIPRLETEQLVEIILDEYSAKQTLSVLDIGTGSGCIAIALKKERPDWNVSAFDISDEALAIAKHNAAKNGVEVNFKEANILKWKQLAYKQAFDLIVSNPPYVLPDEKNILEPQIIKYEPSIALFSENVERLYAQIIEFSDTFLTQNGSLYLEIHPLQFDRITNLFALEKWQTLRLKDYADKARFIIANKQH